MRAIKAIVKVLPFLFTSIICVASATSRLESAPVQWSVNDHWYEARLRPGGIDWQTAQDECIADGGYLATLTSAEEDDFVYSLVGDEPAFWFTDDCGSTIGPWLGGLQIGGSAEPDSGWYWITCEEWSYTNWDSGEPNNYFCHGGSENRLAFKNGDYWNDLPETALVNGYLFEKPAGGPVQWSVNGHWYEARLRPGGIDWQTAQDECIADGGYLATLTAAEEDDFVYSLVGDKPAFWFTDDCGSTIGPWLGGLQVEGSVEPNGGWRWSTCEEWSYTNWDSGEPNNYFCHGGSENRLAFKNGDYWNDLPETALVNGYIFELGEYCPTAVQETTWGAIKALCR